MKLLTNIISFLLIVTFINLEVSAQEVMLDPEFGKNGRVKINGIYDSRFFYDKDSKSLFITSSERVRDGFSNSYFYYKDRIQKINAYQVTHLRLSFGYPMVELSVDILLG